MKIQSQAGSVLLATFSFLLLMTIAALSVFEIANSTYKLSLRNEWRAQAQTVAESEMEFVFYQFKSKIMNGVDASQVVPALSAICENASAPTNCTLATSSPTYRGKYTVGRSVSFDPTFDQIEGIIPGTTKYGTVYYITVHIEVDPAASSPFADIPPFRVGRRFQCSISTIFQYGIFYQGDLEMAPGGNVTINGDISANGSIYMGSSGTGSLTLLKQVRYLASGYFNQDSSGNTTMRKPGTPTGGTLTAPIFAGVGGQASQLETLSAPENLLGGTDAADAVVRRPDLFPTENDVYRALIEPPPADDDPTIAAERVYNRAGLIVTINASGIPTVQTASLGQVTGDVTSQYYNPTASPPVLIIKPATPMYDQREGHNVSVTTIDVAQLNAAITANDPNFNGVLYVNSTTTSASTPAAVKLINGATIPSIGPGGGNGFSVATNAGLYVQGSYNTTTPPLTDGTTPPAMLMGDALTVLSSSWNDANAASDISTRTAAPGTTTINAGILMGNTSATATTASGGVQNVVRYLENWNASSVTYVGSIGRLLESKSFVAPFQQPGQVYGIPANRNFTFNPALVQHRPPGGLTSTAFSRGAFFTW